MYQTFKLFQEYGQLLQAFSTRRGGVSLRPYNSLNLGLHSGDDKQRVWMNRRRFFAALNIPPQQLVFPQQVHGSRVVVATEPGDIPRCDALITNRNNLYLTVQTADCFPVFLFEPHCGVVAALHSGWRGTAAQITVKTISLMVKIFGCNVSNMLAAVGPGVQQRCYQVDQKVASQFAIRYLKEDGPGHFLLDVQGAILDQLKESGIPERQIEWDATCTHCAGELYYSYRRDGSNSGRMMGVIGLR